MESGTIAFPSEGWTVPAEAETAYRSQQGKGSKYTAQALFFFVTTPEVHALHANRSIENAPVPTLIAAANAARKRMPADKTAEAVKFVDSRDLCSYLWGLTDASDCVSAEDLVEPGAAAGASEPAAVVPEVDEKTATRARERALRDRNTALCCRSRSFERVVALIDAEKEAPAKKDGGAGPSRDQRDAHGGGAQRSQQQSRGGRYGWTGEVQGDVEAAYWRQALGDQAKDLEGIQTYGYAAPSTAPSAAPMDVPPPSKRPRPSTAPTSSSHKPAREKKLMVPIIFVPAGYASLLNMLNVQDFLEKGNFVHWENLVDSSERTDIVKVLRKYLRKEKGVKFEIRDKVPTFSSSHQRSEFWERVVAVIVSGAGWQFKDWPWKDSRTGQVDYLTMFQRVRGFQVRYRDEPADERTRPWDIERLYVERNSRHGDHSVMQRFWDALDVFLKKRLDKSALEKMSIKLVV